MSPQPSPASGVAVLDRAVTGRWGAACHGNAGRCRRDSDRDLRPNLARRQAGWCASGMAHRSVRYRPTWLFSGR